MFWLNPLDVDFCKKRDPSKKKLRKATHMDKKKGQVRTCVHVHTFKEITAKGSTA